MPEELNKPLSDTNSDANDANGANAGNEAVPETALSKLDMNVPFNQNEATAEEARIRFNLAPDEEINGIGQIVKKRKRLPAVVFVTIICVFFGAVSLWASLPKWRPPSEPLQPAVKARLMRLPEGTNVLLYLAMSDVRQTGFWKTVVPDSFKTKPLFEDTTGLMRFSQETGFNFLTDSDTLIYAAQSQRDDKFLSIITGNFDTAKVNLFLRRRSDNTRRSAFTDSAYGAGGEPRDIYRTDGQLWLTLASPTELVLGSTADVVENYLQPPRDFFERDTLINPLIEKVQYKSHLWLALGSPQWAMGALQGLTSTNRDLKDAGNVKRIKQLALSLQLGDGLTGQTEWIYESNSSAFFAGGLVWFALWVSKNFSARVSEEEKRLIGAVDIQQNLQSLILRADLPNDLIIALRSGRPTE